MPYATWKNRILDANGTPGVSAYDVWQAFGDDSALALAFLKRESSYASDYDAIPESKRNPWNLQIAGVGLSFDSYVDAAKAWRNRLYSTDYKQGIYDRTKTIADLIGVYAPKSDGNDTEGYIAGVVAEINRNGLDPIVTPPTTPPEPIPGEGEEPVADSLDLIRDYLKEAPVTKQYNGQGYNTGKRTIIGLVEHETQGLMGAKDRQDFFSCPYGERCENALVDFNIQPDGKIYRYQDPFTTNRIPWASGGSQAAITAIAQRASNVTGNPFGGVNAFYASVEIEKNHGAAMTAPQIESTARLLAYICAECGYSADDWKYPNNLGNNVPTSLNHRDLYTSTSCRIEDSDRAKFEARCTELLRDWYAGTTPVPPPAYVNTDPPQAGTFVKNDRLFLAVGKEYTLTKATKPYKYADFKPEQQTGPELPKGSKVMVTHVVSDTGATSDLTLVLDAVTVSGYKIEPGSRIDGKAVAG